jgi:hypothetical protein
MWGGREVHGFLPIQFLVIHPSWQEVIRPAETSKLFREDIVQF